MDEVSDLRRELDERDAEIKRLRALLVAKDVEIGEERGRRLELESYALRLIAFARLGKLALTRPGYVLRKLRERWGGGRG
ncbi:MAG TPA: hypothetical protein VF125_07990 [Solirubrobacterales bacterium]